MKHISAFLEVRKQQIDEHRKFSAFAPAGEKGSGEWSAFNAVRDDSGSGYRVRLPKKPIVIKEPQYVIRIIYPYRRLKSA
ncbi:MAG: hypothetical protein HYS26_00795 [Candidatus Kaiserbacteria bacterium]|nr:MAG: hypothetical protein HYS26_00795 [Candidatus Kaiserbacteria bacterium]